VIILIQGGFVIGEYPDDANIGEIFAATVAPYLADDPNADPGVVVAVLPEDLTINREFLGPPPAPEITPEILAATKDMAKHRVVMKADQLADLITGQVPRGERDAWASKAQAARDHQDGTAKAWQTAMLQTEADLRGETIDALAVKIAVAASRYEAISAMIAAQRSSVFQTIDSAKSPPEIETILSNASAAAATILSTVQNP